MLRFILLQMLFLGGSLAAAEIKIPLIGLGWQMSFEGPALKKLSLEYPEGTVQFRGNSGRFNVSVFVEPPPPDAKEATHAACRDFYWAQGSRNPAIVADSIKKTTLPNSEIVEYRSKGEFQGQAYVQDHVNCYFVHEGRWMDLHASLITPEEGDAGVLRKVATSLVYGPMQKSEGKAETIVLPKLGSLRLTLPVGWVRGNLLVDDLSFQDAVSYTVSFFSSTDPNSNCLISLMAPPKPPANVEELHVALADATNSIAPSSVEGKAVVRDLKLKQGMGAVASFTDASLVGKPVEAGNAKALASGMLVLKPGTLGVVSMFMDDARGPDAEKMLQALETLTLE